MPSWLKKRFQVLKSDLISHLVVVKSHKKFQLKQLNTTQQLNDTNNERISNNTKSPIQKIRNDLKAHRFRNKSDINSYHDYAKWRDQVLISQNNCALRCIKEEKFNNTDYVDSQYGATNQTNCTSQLDSRRNHCNDKSASRDVANDHANCDSESEWMMPFYSHHIENSRSYSVS